MEYFKYNNKIYQVVVKTQKSVVALNKDSCCVEIMDFRVNGKPTQHWASGTNPYAMIGKVAAIACKDIDNSCLVGGDVVEAPIKCLMDEGQSIYTLLPEPVSGTSQGSVYRKIAQTEHGYVARREADGLYNPRIRVVNPKHRQWPDGFQFTNKDTGLLWETIEKGHISAQSGVADRAILLIARGLEVLLKL